MPSLKGQFLVGGLKARKIVAVDVSGAAPVETEPFPDVSGRIRDVRALSDGSIAVLFETAGRAIRIIPNT